MPQESVTSTGEPVQQTTVSGKGPHEAHVVGYFKGWRDAVAFLRQHADAHAGKWAGMEPREAIKAAAQAMEDDRG